jgi:hypothetical protein
MAMENSEWMKPETMARLRESVAQAFVSDVFRVMGNHYQGPITLADEALAAGGKTVAGITHYETDMLNQHLVHGLRDVVSRPGAPVSREVSDWNDMKAPEVVEFVHSAGELSKTEFRGAVGSTGLLTRVGQIAGYIYRLFCPFLNQGREAQSQNRSNDYYLEGRLLEDMWSRVADLPFRVEDTSFFGREWYKKPVGGSATDLSVYRTVSMIDPVVFRHAYVDGNGWPALLNDHGHHGSRLYSIMAASFWDVIGKEVYGG